MKPRTIKPSKSRHTTLTAIDDSCRISDDVIERPRSVPVCDPQMALLIQQYLGQEYNQAKHLNNPLADLVWAFVNNNARGVVKSNRHKCSLVSI